MSLLRDVTFHLEAEAIAFTLIGANALAVHGVSRSTLDVDLLTVDDRVLRRDVWANVEARGCDIRISKGDADDPLAGCVRLAAEGAVVDVILGRYAWQKALIEASPVTSVGALSLPVAPPYALILLKLHAGGPKDAWDIRALLESIATPDAVVAEVEHGLPLLPEDARKLWARIRTEA
jgi:hypothetical protein